ncbi:MAG: response regulator transcription factor [Clostridia bacterium]|nr:response regulator transcription factor [Clostridia bacterium]
MPIRLLIADDDALIRDGLKIILGMDGDFEIVDCVDNGLKALELCLREKIDVALLDVRMPVMNGVQAAREICEKTSVKPLILTTFDDDEFITTAVRNGVRGYLLKNNPPDKIKDAIKMVYGGNTVMQDIVMDKIKEGLNTVSSSKLDKSMFSDRELEIMELISKGLSNREISGKLYISEGTVKNYITSVLNKTGLEHRTQIAIYYLNGGRL